MNIFVSNLPSHVDNDGLLELFKPYGEVSSAKVIMDRETNRSKEFGFVEMDTIAGQSAIDGLNGTDLAGKQLSVAVSKPKTDNGPFFVTTRRSGTSGGSRRGY